jgi:uncharacterized protein YlaI
VARTTKTTYTCDSCGSAVERMKDLGAFSLEGGRSWKTTRIIRTELCDDCEGKFLGVVESFFRDTLAGDLMEMRRPS